MSSLWSMRLGCRDAVRIALGGALLVGCSSRFSSSPHERGGTAGASAMSGGTSGGASGQPSVGGAGGLMTGAGRGGTSGGTGGHAGGDASGGTGTDTTGTGGHAGKSEAGGSNGQGGASGTTGGTTGGAPPEGGNPGQGGSAVAAGNGGISGTAGVAGTDVTAGMAGGGTSAGGRGGASTGGRGGAAGAASSCKSPLAVDDMEDGDHLTCPNQGRSGDWWTATGTTTGTIDPSTHGDFPAYALGADARAGSSYGMRLSGQNFGHTDDDWASLGFNVVEGASYDLTPYTGLAFYAKSKAGALELHVEFATDTTTPVDDGGACTSDCTDHYSGAVSLTGDWQEFSVPLATIAQEGWGVKPKDLAHTRFVYFGYLGTDGGPAAFEFLIDDVRLY